jgi:hypothetical protein
VRRKFKEERHRGLPLHDARVASLDGLLLLSEPEGVQRDSGNLDDSESDSWQITDGMAGTTETSDEDLVVLIDERHTAISGDEASNPLVVFLELHSDTLSDGGVGLLGLDGDLLDDDAGGVRGALEGLSPLGVLMRLVVVVIGPSTQVSQTIYLFSLL